MQMYRYNYKKNSSVIIDILKLWNFYEIIFALHFFNFYVKLSEN